MGLNSILRGAVKVIDKVVDDVKVDVWHDIYADDARKGNPTYTRKKRRAVIDKKLREVRASDGTLVSCTTTIIVTDPSIIVKVHDRFFDMALDGGEVIAIGGVPDRTTNRPYALEAYLG